MHYLKFNKLYSIQSIVIFNYYRTYFTQNIVSTFTNYYNHRPRKIIKMFDCKPIVVVVVVGWDTDINDNVIRKHISRIKIPIIINQPINSIHIN